MDAPGPMPTIDVLFGCNEDTEQLWIPSDTPKAYGTDDASLFPTAVNQYPSIPCQHCCPRQVYLSESANDPCLSRTIFEPDPMSHPVSMNNILPRPPLFNLTPQTVTPYQVFSTTLITPTPSFSEFLTFDTDKPQTPATPAQAYLSIPSKPATPVSDGTDYYKDVQISPSAQQQRQFCRKHRKPNSIRGSSHSASFKCKERGCERRFKRQEHLNRHMKSHTKERPHVCWVPGCQLAFTRKDNLKEHCKRHSKRGGRNRYVATLDTTSPDYDPEFRGQLTSDGLPLYGSKPEDSVASLVPTS